MYLAHPGPALRQGQWNVVKLGNPTHAGQCKQQRFKNIRIEAVDPTAPKTIPIMTDGVINVSFDLFIFNHRTFVLITIYINLINIINYID